MIVYAYFQGVMSAADGLAWNQEDAGSSPATLTKGEFVMEESIRKLRLKAGEKAGRERTCGNKVKYSEASATKAAKKMNTKPSTRKELEAYPCFFCGQWHVGRKMSKEELEIYVQ